jgi:hypothetical protein
VNFNSISSIFFLCLFLLDSLFSITLAPAGGERAIYALSSCKAMVIKMDVRISGTG